MKKELIKEIERVEDWIKKLEKNIDGLDLAVEDNNNHSNKQIIKHERKILSLNKWYLKGLKFSRGGK